MSDILNRRDAIAFGGAAFVAWVGGKLCAADASGRPLPEGDAYAPWRLWNDPSVRGTPLALVAAAVLAANPHDTQPWLFAVEADAIEIYADLSRNLGAMDPYVREMHLGLGCAIENMVLAAPSNGFGAEVEATAGSLTVDDRQSHARAATVHLAKRAPVAPDALCIAIPDRHTNRYAYDRGKAPASEWRRFASDPDIGDGVRVILVEDGEQRRLFDAAIIEATEAIIADAAMIADSDRWFRDSSQAIEAHRDGPTLDAAGLPFFTLLFARAFSVSPETSHRGWLKQTREVQVPTAPLVGLIAVRDRYDRGDAIAAGRAWQRLHLNATAHGMAMQPLNQPIEMIDRERQLGRAPAWAGRIARLTGDDWQATFSFRAGFATQSAPASPRRRLKDVLMG